MINTLGNVAIIILLTGIDNSECILHTLLHKRGWLVLSETTKLLIGHFRFSFGLSNSAPLHVYKWCIINFVKKNPKIQCNFKKS